MSASECECCHEPEGVSRQKRSCDDFDATPGSAAAKVRRGLAVTDTARVTSCPSVNSAAALLIDSECIASTVKRPLGDGDMRGFADYLASCQHWPDTEHLHPMEPTRDRVAIIDFSKAPSAQASDADGLHAAIGYGQGLPPRFSDQVASANQAIAQVMKVLPEHLATVTTADATELLVALREHTGRRQFKIHLELVLGDTCRKWHCDNNIARTLVTYAGPGTLCAHEDGVKRDADGRVVNVLAHAQVQMEAGDFLMMKGGMWAGSEGRGAAHRAPHIGPVPACSSHRLLLKVDVADDF